MTEKEIIHEELKGILGGATKYASYLEGKRILSWNEQLICHYMAIKDIRKKMNKQVYILKKRMEENK